MTPNEIVKEEADDEEVRRLFNSTSGDEIVNSSITSPDPIKATLGGVESESTSIQDHNPTPRPCTTPAPADSLTKSEMKPIFVATPWPTYLNLPEQPYTDYVTAADMNYTPQEALEQAFLMLKRVEDCINRLNMHTGLRRIMWRKKISELKTYNHGFITIAICGGTGAGKSSLINAVLDAHILPTSDSRACTSAIVEVRHHRHPFFSAEIEFFARPEWRNELQGMRDDAQSRQNPDGDAQFDPEFIAHVDAALQKGQAAYPLLGRHELETMKPDEIIDSDPNTACLLGTTKMIEGKTPTEFRNALASFITARSGARPNSVVPQLWPFVKKVRVYVKCAALESGSRLVDLPGTGDANEARNNVAKSYLKEADYIWIVAPIKRAADESVANDLIDENLKTDLRLDNKYDHRHIAFIATGTDHVSEREIIESLELDQDPGLLEIQAELASIGKTLKQRKNETHAPPGQDTIFALEKRRADLKKRRKQTLARKRNEHMKMVIQQKFRTGIVEMEPNPRSDDPRAQTIGTQGETSIQGSTNNKSSEVPVFTCSSFDYVGLNMEDEYDPVCFNQVEDTEIPRLQNFCYDLALPAQREPVLRVFQGLEKFLCRLREFGTDGSHSYADRLFLANKWESNIPSADEHVSFLSILNGASTAGSEETTPDASNGTSKPTLRSVVAHVSRLNATNSSNQGFSHQFNEAVKTVVANCVAYLKQEIRGALEELFLKGATEAEAKALATHDLFASPIVHWATYRATLRREGEFRRNLNEELVAPITRRQLEVWPYIFKKRLLAPMASDAKLKIEAILNEVKLSSPAGVYAICASQCQLTLLEAQATVNEIERGLMILVVREQRALSRFLAPVIKDVLGAAYREAIEIRGRKSTELQKNVFRNHVDALRHTMFTESVTKLMEKLDYIPNAIGLILPATLNEVACQAEVNLASLWQMPRLGKEEVEKRKEFIRETDNILRQARLWLTVIPTQ